LIRNGRRRTPNSWHCRASDRKHEHVRGFNDVVRIYDTARRGDIGYNLAYIGRDFTVPPSTPFDPAYMRALLDEGYRKALRGYDPTKRPPSV
jgi:hypothetical protein